MKHNKYLLWRKELNSESAVKEDDEDNYICERDREKYEICEQCENIQIIKMESIMWQAETSTKMDRQTDRQPGRQADRQTVKQTNSRIDKNEIKKVSEK